MLEVGDVVAVLNTEFRPGTDEKYMTVHIVKRRRIDKSESEFEKYTYLAHPFARNNGMRLIDDINLDKVLSLQSLVSDISVDSEKTNAVPRLKQIVPMSFEEDY